VRKQSKKKKSPAKRASQPRLPGTQDGSITALDNSAREYVEIRDERMELTKRETKLKKKLLDLMHENNRTTYRYQDVDVELIQEPAEEIVKVKIIKPASSKGKNKKKGEVEAGAE
jgi:hypothetical protein